MRNLGVVDSDLSVPRHKDIKIDHNLFINRDMENQHPASAIKYDNENTEFNANNMQDIIDELDFNDKIVSNAQGTLISITDSSERKLDNLRIYGKTTQDGTPSPENPIPLVSTGDSGEVNVQVCGKNLLNPAPNDSSEAYMTVNSDGSITLSNTTASVKYPATVWTVLPPGEYILRRLTTFSDGAPFLQIGSSDDYSRNAVQKSISFTLSEPTQVRMLFSMNAGADCTIYPQLERGSAYTDFEGYINCGDISLPIDSPLPGIPVNSDGNYTDENGQQWICDEIDFGRGVYVQRIYSCTLSGNEQWEIMTVSTGVKVFRAAVYEVDAIIIPKSGKSSVGYIGYQDMDNGAYGLTYAYGFRVRFADMNPDSNTLDELRAYLAENPISALIVLKTPIETPLTAEEIAAYKVLHTNKSNTTIINDSNAYMSVDYIVNNHTAEYVSKRFEELESNNTGNGIVDITPGVTGTLGVGNGGTGYTSITDTNYTTMRYRGSVLVANETTADSLLVNGAVAWIYE